MNGAIARLCCFLAVVGGVALPAAATGGPDWEAVTDVEVIEILTVDDDGEVRETKVWFVLIDGVSYLRTSDSRWLENIRRDPKVAIRIGDRTHRQVAHEVTSDAWIEKVDAATREIDEARCAHAIGARGVQRLDRRVLAIVLGRRRARDTQPRE